MFEIAIKETLAENKVEKKPVDIEASLVSV